MAMADIEADYLVIGAGATAMAFVDTLLRETADATVVMVDRKHRPGGHWNDAYPFVRLHQPSEFYGVASRELSRGTKYAAGPNAGLNSLATGSEVLDHFDRVMEEEFLPSGRVRWLPMSEHGVTANGRHQVTSLTSGERRVVAVGKKVVDATHARTEVPSTHSPKYAVAPGVQCWPPNRLPQIAGAYEAYTVVGSGKTGMDAILWLLDNGVSPSRIRWIMPRDAWVVNRANWQPGLENFERSMGGFIAQYEAIIGATSVADLFARLEEAEVLLRIDPSVEPTTYRCAVVSHGELAQLRRIRDIVRLGRVRRIESTSILLEQGTVPATPGTLYVDCSAGAIVKPPALPVFDGERINLLMVRTCQPLFSAALIAWVESHVADEEEKNDICAAVPSPERPSDWLPMAAANLRNGRRWREHAGLSAWLARCRLNLFAVFMRGVTPDDADRLRLVETLRARSAQAEEKLATLLAASEGKESP